MEPNLSSNPNEKMNSRSSRNADQTIKPRPNSSSDGQAQNPVYSEGMERDKAKAKLSESYEGFSGSQSVGMPNLEKADGFGSKFQMPGPDMSEKYMDNNAGSQDLERKQLPLSPEASQGEGFVDLQTSVQLIQELVQKIRANLESTEQEDLEALLKQGAQLLTANWKQLSSSATEQVSTIKSDVKENPYRTVIAALKVGMALGQVIASLRKERVSEPVLKDDEDFGALAL